jgi:hypothetical protein
LRPWGQEKEEGSMKTLFLAIAVSLICSCAPRKPSDAFRVKLAEGSFFNRVPSVLVNDLAENELRVLYDHEWAGFFFFIQYDTPLKDSLSTYLWHYRNAEMVSSPRLPLDTTALQIYELANRIVSADDIYPDKRASGMEDGGFIYLSKRVGEEIQIWECSYVKFISREDGLE